MGTIASIIEAIRRIGTSSQKSALERQDQQLSNKTVLDRGVTQLRTEQGITQVFTASTEPVEESWRVVNASESLDIEDWAARAPMMCERYLGKSIACPTPEELDDIFRAWAHSPERALTTSDEIVRVLGAAFGQHCVETIDMQWVVVSDVDGTAIAIKGIHKDFRGYPFHSTLKRIEANEQDFFVPIFALLQKNSSEAGAVLGVA